MDMAYLAAPFFRFLACFCCSRAAASNNIWRCVCVWRVVLFVRCIREWCICMYVCLFVRTFGRRVYPIHVLLSLRLLLFSHVRLPRFFAALFTFLFSFLFPFPFHHLPLLLNGQKLSRFMLRDAHAHTDIQMPVVDLPKRKHKRFPPTFVSFRRWRGHTDNTTGSTLWRLVGGKHILLTFKPLRVLAIIKMCGNRLDACGNRYRFLRRIEMSQWE